ncbi:Malonyl CoA-acyl carrier protein transacylase [Saezia sanguinis]|uniref:Malonyl CoA-acyl carrier protein transacylase n=1 Tax=Saezia sanguinis TaxID=1965230 RepID=A0A433SC69_9BURK|nr:ACP S-malonyltransferase [Saezia sanguinis]RUS66347.1 Malonyl CoA-acyl carrier protein transacylase [Saezia sanguinis]
MKPFAFVFPGQGSQSVGMLDAWGDHPVVRESLAQANEALGEDIGALIQNGPKEALALTTNTQPAMLVAGVIAYRVWMAETGAAPQVVAGHSLGEYSALVAAGVLRFEDAVALVRFRAQAMQEAVPVGVGAMAAVLGLAAPEVVKVCAQIAQESQEVVEAVNFNDASQTVIAGSKAGVEKACEAMKATGAKRAMLLPVSAPFHSSLMKPAAEKLKAKMDTVQFAAPQIPVINNVDVAVVSDPQAIRDALYRQAFGPVRWVEDMMAVKQWGITQVVECGPGKVLLGMLKRIDAELVGNAVFDPATLSQTQEALA